ncbi:MAG: 5'-nucleotidase [Armatimonadetes bacterium]|nr:5'-nucleotidase [Armatimonadota bacterium]
MPYTLEDKLVIAVSTSAVFDFSEADNVFRENDEDAYRRFQRERIDDVATPGVAFSLVKKLLRINDGGNVGVEVIFISKNDPFSGLRGFRSAREHGLDITRGIFTRGRSPFPYVKPLNPVLFLSTDEKSVREALDANIPAARVSSQTPFVVDRNPDELRIALDGDGVLFDDGSETVFQQFGIETFHEHEVQNAHVPLSPGPLRPFVEGLQRVQASHGLRTRIALVTARNAPSHERALRTLDQWGVDIDEAFFLGGLPKAPFLMEFGPDLFFDDQLSHLERAEGVAAVAHVPFGLLNRVRPADASSDECGLGSPEGGMGR